MNLVILKGNMARDPELRTIATASGKSVSVTSFAIATNRFFKKANGERDKETNFIECEAWDSGAETIAQLLVKGDPVLLEGSLKVETWEQDGKKRSRMKVRVRTFEKLFRSNKTSDDESSASGEYEEDAVPAGAGDDIPF